MAAGRTADVPSLTAAQLRAGVRSTYVAFIGSGFAFASWASRIPQVRAHLHLSPGALGFVLLSIAAGSVIALPLSGSVVHRLGSRRTVAGTALLLGAGLVLTAVGYRVGVAAVVLGLFLLGFANGAWDVAMNVHAALVEQHVRRSIMSRFHAGFSVGTVAGAVIGAAMVLLRVPVTAHLMTVGIAVGIGVPWGTRGFLDDAVGPPSGDQPRARHALAAWSEPRTVVIGVFVLAFAFAEGTGNDWISLAAIDGYGVSPAVGTSAFAVFLAAMTCGRWFGPAVLDRFGRVAVIRVLAATGAAGSLLFVLAPVTPLAFVGVALWGLGTSLGFPVGMSAGADVPRHAAARVSVIASIGYCAFLAGPPVVGFLGDRLTVLHAMSAVAVLLSVAALLSTVLAAPPDLGEG